MNLKQQAQQMAAYYLDNDKLGVLFIGGSVSRGWDDRFSDIELFLLWNEEPNEQDRLSPIHKAHGHVLDFHPYEENEWSETYLVDGTKFEISSFLIETANDYIHEGMEGNISLDKQCLLAAIIDGRALKGSEKLQELKGRIQPYPSRLKRRMIHRYLEFGGGWKNRKALVARNDVLMLHKVMVDVSMKLTCVLCAVNGMYIAHPGFKWLKATCSRMDVKPNFFAERIEGLLTERDLKKGVKDLECLVSETCQLIQIELPDIDMTSQMVNIEMLRPGAKSE